MWLEPQVLHLVSPHLSSFREITTLSLHSLSLSLFSQADINAIFGHFFFTVKKLNLDDPNSTPQALIHFICRFSVMENLAISSPRWASPDGRPAAPIAHIPPFTGKLCLYKFQQDSATFVRLLSMLPINFGSVAVVDCGWDPLPFNRLLYRVSHTLKYLAVSAWFNGTLLFVV
jgi:hypothetical protein